MIKKVIKKMDETILADAYKKGDHSISLEINEGKFKGKEIHCFNLDNEYKIALYENDTITYKRTYKTPEAVKNYFLRYAFNY